MQILYTTFSAERSFLWNMLPAMPVIEKQNKRCSEPLLRLNAIVCLRVSPRKIYRLGETFNRDRFQWPRAGIPGERPGFQKQQSVVRFMFTHSYTGMRCTFSAEPWWMSLQTWVYRNSLLTYPTHFQATFSPHEGFLTTFSAISCPRSPYGRQSLSIQRTSCVSFVSCVHCQRVEM